MKAVVIIGASGAIGRAMAAEIRNRYPGAFIHAFSRTPVLSFLANTAWHEHDITNEASTEKAASSVTQPLDAVIVASGHLHDKEGGPEKALKELSFDALEKTFRINSIGPAIVAKHFLPKLKRKERSVFAALSARVGSIEDNRLGGWYSYRTSKAALNMLLRTASIEVRRQNKQAIVLGLHPGTVDSALSRPFQKNVPKGRLFAPDLAAQRLLTVIETAKPSDSGNLFDYAGYRIPF